MGKERERKEQGTDICVPVPEPGEREPKMKICSGTKRNGNRIAFLCVPGNARNGNARNGNVRNGNARNGNPRNCVPDFFNIQNFSKTKIHRQISYV